RHRRLRRGGAADPWRLRQASDRRARGGAPRSAYGVPPAPWRRRSVPREGGARGRSRPHARGGGHHDGRGRGPRTGRSGRMSDHADAVRRAEEVLRTRFTGDLRSDAALAPFTTFRIGGPAALYAEPEGEEDLRALAEAASRSGLPVTVAGKGSNLLVSDRGFEGLVVRLGKGFRWSRVAGWRIGAGAAMPL